MEDRKTNRKKEIKMSKYHRTLALFMKFFRASQLFKLDVNQKIRIGLKHILDRKGEEFHQLLGEIKELQAQLGISFLLDYSVTAESPTEALKQAFERMREDKRHLEEARSLFDETFHLCEKVQKELQKSQSKEIEGLLLQTLNEINILRTYYIPQRRWQTFRERIGKLQASLEDTLYKITRDVSYKGLERYYRVLGVPIGASHQKIKEAYRKLARQYHPDMHPEEKKKWAEEKFKELEEAYSELTKKMRGGKNGK
jgi:DnaJ-domain-containing protein 1